MTAIGSITTAFALIFIIRTFQNGRKQLFISNFAEITNHVGDEKTKEIRGWFTYNEEKKKLLSDFIQTYDKNYYDKSAFERLKYDEIEKACWHLASRYDRVGVLLSIDDKIRKKFLDYHKEALLQAWNALKPLIQKRDIIINERDKTKKQKSYKYFQELVEKVESDKANLES